MSIPLLLTVCVVNFSVCLLLTLWANDSLSVFSELLSDGRLKARQAIRRMRQNLGSLRARLFGSRKLAPKKTALTPVSESGANYHAEKP